jgi:hypothetical protein
MSRLLSRADVIFALGYTPYPDDNPAAYFGPDEYDAHLPAAAAPKNSPTFSGPWSFSASGIIHGDATVSGTLFLTGGPSSALRIGTPAVAGSPAIALHSSGGGTRLYDALIEATGGSTSVDGQAVLNVRASELRLNGGPLTFYGKRPPASQPPTPATLADVIGILRSFGLCA